MNTFSRLHMVSILAEFLKGLKRLIVPGLLIYFTGKNSELDFLELKYQYSLAVIGLLIALFFGFYRWSTFKYRIENDEVHIKKGLFIKQDIFISKEKIKSIDVTGKIVPRLFGLLQLNIKIEGVEDNNPKISFVALSKENAKKIQNVLASNNPISSEDNLKISSENQTSQNTLKITNKEIFLFSLTSNALLPSMVTITALIIQFNDQFSFTNYTSILEIGFVEKISWISLIVLSAFLLATVKSMIQFNDFELKILKDKIIITKGILEKKEMIVLVEDIKAIKIEENILRQLLGYSTVYVESSSNDSEKNNVSMVLMPLIKNRVVSNFLASILPLNGENLETNNLPRKATTSYFIRSFLICIPLIVVIFAITKNFFLISLIAALSLVWGWIKFKEVRYGFRGEYLKIRTRFIRRNTFIIRKNHIETLYFSQTSFQKKNKLATLKVVILSNISKKSYKLFDYVEEDQNNILSWYRERTTNKFDRI